MLENLKIEYILLSELKPNEYNPKKMTDEEAMQLEKSITEFGIVDPIIVNKAQERKNIIIGGHQRYKIYQKLKYKKVPIIYLNISDIKKESELCLRLSKNNGSWNFDLLANFDEELLKNIGWSSSELDAIFQTDPKPEDDAVPEIRTTKIKRGDIFQLGNHRLGCLDATSKDDMAKLMGDDKADAIITDPPYGLGEAKSFNKNHPDYKDDKPFDLSLLELSMPFVIWGGNYYDKLPIPRNKIGWIVWDKRPDLEAEKRKRADRRFGQHFEIAITNISDLRGKMFRKRWGGYYGSEEIMHKTQKPVELFEWCIIPTKRQGIILDVFGGSGSTMIASHKLNRRCFMAEIDPIYVSVIIRRMIQYDPTLKIIKNGKEWRNGV